MEQRFRNRSKRGKSSRISLRMPFKKRLLIVGEGKETEPNYFGKLKKESTISKKFNITVKRGPGFSPLCVVQEVVKHKEQGEKTTGKYEKVICVLDVETADKRDSLNEAIILAADKDIKLILSNPSFEVWILSHFERKARAYANCDRVIEKLNTHWNKHFGHDYVKSDKRIFDNTYDNIDDAMSNAEWVRDNHHGEIKETADANSSTDVYKLIKYLRGELEDL